jgi:hypothetical protein
LRPDDDPRPEPPAWQQARGAASHFPHALWPAHHRYRNALSPLQPSPLPSPHPRQLLGPEAANANADVSSLPLEPPREGAPLSRRLCALLAALRAGHAAAQPAFAVRQGMPAEAVAMPLLVEDRSAGQMGYADFLLALHKAVMSK